MRNKRPKRTGKPNRNKDFKKDHEQNRKKDFKKEHENNRKKDFVKKHENHDDLIFGVNPVKEAILSGTKIKEIIVGQKSLMNDPLLKDKKVKFLDPSSLKKRFGENTQNIVARIEPFQYTSLERLIRSAKEDSTIVLLDHITDPHNFGAIIRTCDASGVHGIVIPEKRSVQVNSTVFKTSAGAVNHANIAQVVNLVSAIKTLKDNGFWVYGAEADGDSDLFTAKVSGKVAVVMGSEGKGLSRLVRDNLDFVLNIRMDGKVNSLNVSVATAVILFEIYRKRLKTREK